MRNKILCIVSFCVCISFGGCEEIKDIIPDRLTPEEIVEGLKAALNKGSEMASVHAFGSALPDFAGGGDGFLNNKHIPDIRIPLPESISPMMSAINQVPPAVWPVLKTFSSDYDIPAKFIELERVINIAASVAAKGAFNAFVPVIRDMNISDGLQLLKSENNTAATEYMFTEAGTALNSTFKDVIDIVLGDQVKVIDQFWTPLVSTYNKIQGPDVAGNTLVKIALAAIGEDASLLSFGPAVEPNLDDYIATKAIDGLQRLVAREETLIRSNPGNYAEEIIRRVFGHKDD